ncbi:MAG: LacI family DNA-binding transcriptional regulator [Candidatus Limnocylindrales bacterium]
MADVAGRVGVSTATVSRILSGALQARPETRERVFAAVEELGYRPSGVARSLKLQRTGTIGLIITDVENPFFAEIVRAVEDAAMGLAYAVVLCNGADDPEREGAYLEILAERRVDGIIVATGGVGARHARWLATTPLPVVMMSPRADGLHQRRLT